MTRILLLSLFGLTGCLSFQTKDNPFQLQAEQSVVLSSGWRIYYRKMGRVGQPAVVFIHGYGSASLVWLPLMRALTKQGYHCLALDLPGFGLSDKRAGNYATTQIARILEEFLQKKAIQRADLVAHSWGSSVALAFALQSGKMVRRIVINSGWIYQAQIVPVIRWAQIPVIGEMIYGLFYRELPGEKLAHSVYDARRYATQAVVEQILRSYRRPGALASALAVARGMDFRNMESRYHTIAHPVLLQWGRQDRVALPFYGKRLEAHLPNARLQFLDRCGHLPMLERPHAFARNILRFLGPARRPK